MYIIYPVDPPGFQRIFPCISSDFNKKKTTASNIWKKATF